MPERGMKRTKETEWSRSTDGATVGLIRRRSYNEWHRQTVPCCLFVFDLLSTFIFIFKDKKGIAFPGPSLDLATARQAKRRG